MMLYYMGELRSMHAWHHAPVIIILIHFKLLNGNNFALHEYNSVKFLVVKMYSLCMGACILMYSYLINILLTYVIYKILLSLCA